jgi:hypothetical protein
LRPDGSNGWIERFPSEGQKGHEAGKILITETPIAVLHTPKVVLMAQYVHEKTTDKEIEIKMHESVILMAMAACVPEKRDTTTKEVEIKTREPAVEKDDTKPKEKKFEVKMRDPAIMQALNRLVLYRSGTSAFTKPIDTLVCFWFCTGKSYYDCLMYMRLILVRV